MGGGGMGSRGGPAGPPTDETADLLALRKKLLEKKARLDQMLRQAGGGAPVASTRGKNGGGKGSQRQQGGRGRSPAMPRMESTPNFVPSVPDNAMNGAKAACACCVGADVCSFLPRFSHGLQRSASAPPTQRPAFSFDPEHDPVVSAMVNRAQAQAAARLKQQRVRAEQERAANETLKELTPAQLAARRHQEREQRLSAKRKFAELSCAIERVAAQAVQSARRRDDLGNDAELAEEEAAAAEIRRKTHLAGRSVRESAPGRVARNGGVAPLWDSAAFAAVAAKRKLEVVNRQCLAALKQLMAHKWAHPFNKPVDHVALNLPTYPEIVKRPMDLGTVEANIRKGGVYACAEEVHADVTLVFSNAKTFTPKPEMDVHVMAVALEEFWAQRWVAVADRAKEVEEGMTVEKECAEKKSEEMNARKRLASEEMRCAGLMAELDRLRRQLDDLKRQTRSICRPMTTAEKDQLRRNLTNIPDCYRQDIRDIIAETEGAHKVPVDGVENWNEIIEEFNEFGPVALRRLARFVKVRRRNANLIAAGKAPRPADGFDADEWDEWDVPPPTTEATPQQKEEEELNGKNGDTAGAPNRGPGVEATNADEAMAAAAAAAAAAAVGTSVEPVGPDPLMAMLAGDFQPAAGFKSSDSAPELVEVVKIHSAPVIATGEIGAASMMDVLTEPA